MGLDAFGCDRIYAPVKGRIENTQAADLPFRLNQFSLFITGNCFSISLPVGNIDTFGLTAHVLNIAVRHRYLKYMKAHIHIELCTLCLFQLQDKGDLTSQNNVHLSIYRDYLYVKRGKEKYIVRYNFSKKFQIHMLFIFIHVTIIPNNYCMLNILCF